MLQMIVQMVCIKTEDGSKTKELSLEFYKINHKDHGVGTKGTRKKRS